jgi:hypothetical protein
MQTFFLSTSTLQSDQKENKSRVLPHLLIYRNVCHSLGCPIIMLLMHSRFIGCLPLKKLLIIT